MDEPPKFDNQKKETDEVLFGKKEHPSVRTMESDISKYMKTEKPSIITLLTRRKAGEFKTGPRKKSPFLKIAAGSIILFSLLGILGYYGVRYFSIDFQGQPEPSPINTGAGNATPYLSSEESQSIVIQDGQDPLLSIRTIAETPSRFGTLRTVEMIIENGKTRLMTFKDLMRLLDASPPSDMEFVTAPLIQPFLYFADQRPVFGTLFAISDKDRTLQDMLSWEATMVRDLNGYLLGRPAEIAISFFEDRIHNSVPYRFARLSFSEDLGVGYAIIPKSKNLLLITTSEEAMRVLIARILQQ